MSTGEIREQLLASTGAIDEAVECQHAVNDKMIALGQLGAGIQGNLNALVQQLTACEQLIGDNTELQAAAKGKIDESVTGIKAVADGTQRLDYPMGLLVGVSQGSQQVIDTTRMFGEHLPTIKADIKKMETYIGSFVARVNGVGQVAGMNITTSLTARADIEEMTTRI